MKRILKIFGITLLTILLILGGLAAAMPDYQDWNNGSQGYRNAMNTFLEYMTFGMYSLFAQTQFADWEYEYAIQKLEQMMAEQRGFYRFPEFNQELLDYVTATPNPDDMDALYRHMINWMEKQSTLFVQTK